MMVSGEDFMAQSPRNAFSPKGVGRQRHAQKLMSFELALRDAGIEKQNLVRVSSIYPTVCKIIPAKEGIPKLKPGQITFVVLAEAATDEPNRLICAGIGLAIPKNHAHGYIAEHHGYGMSEKKTEDLVEDLAATMLATTLGIPFDADRGLGRARAAVQDERRNRQDAPVRADGRGRQERPVDQRGQRRRVHHREDDRRKGIQRLVSRREQSRCFFIRGARACDGFRGRQVNMPVPFCKLADPAGYVSCNWDLTSDAPGRAHWLDLFRSQLKTHMKLAMAAAESRGQVDPEWLARAKACAEELYAELAAFDADPASRGRVTIITLDQWRDRILRRHGFVDPFAEFKHRENAAALPLLPLICRELDDLRDRPQLDAVLTGLLAGNIFDMGAGATASAYLAAGPDFHKTRERIFPRPWLIDDYDKLAARLLEGMPYKKAVFFVDNAGSDFFLGVLPMIRWLAQRGTSVVLAANQRPTLNDMTAAATTATAR
jgi:arginine decarboxylase